MLQRKTRTPVNEGLTDDPLWFRDAVIYELRVRSFNDSNGDGIGDLPGLTEKLDYLQDLGVNALWLLPICPSPMRDDGYDISDYCDVQPDIGTLDDFRTFVNEAHRRGLRVITELVLNHTSDQHPWFQRARRAPPGSVERDFYVWTDTPDRYREARIIFKDFETSNWAWDSIARSYYWHRFYSHQPDLNFENPAVRQAALEVVDFWCELGVDGLRLDAVPYLFEKDGTNCENLPETHAFLRELRAHIDGKFRNRMLLAEANQWPEDAARYFGAGDECHMNFHFPIMPRLFMSIDMEDRFPILDILAQTPVLPEQCQWALFLRNHDELTLEMVTDEERDYMYRAYAHDPTMRINLGIRRRLAPLVQNNRRKMELMNGLLASLPGTPVLYYGDEIGMGDNIYLGDRNGVRTPMQWSADRNAGFSRANPQKLILPVTIDPEYHYESLNVEAQQNNTNSLLWWMKRLLALRKRFHAFGRGSVEMLTPQNHRVLAFIRRFGEETILVVANLSRFIQYVELDLTALKGRIPVELFGRTEFPPIGELPYLLTLGGHAFYWFSLEERQSTADAAREQAYLPPVIEVAGSFRDLIRGPETGHLEAVLANYLPGRRWYESRNRELRNLQLVDSFPLSPDGLETLILRAEYTEGDSETYALPVSIESGTTMAEVRVRAPQSIIAQVNLRGRKDEAVLIDALADGHRVSELVNAMTTRIHPKGATGTLMTTASTALASAEPGSAPGEARALQTEHGRAVFAFDEQYLLKVVRRLGEGVSPDVEIGRALAERRLEAPVPALLGTIEYRKDRAEPLTVATLQTFVPHEATAWRVATQEIGRFFERTLTAQVDWPGLPERPLLELAASDVPEAVEQTLGASLSAARLIGARTAQLHLSLASPNAAGTFSPEPYTSLDQRSLYQSMRNLTGRVLREIRSFESHTDVRVAECAREILKDAPLLYERFESLLRSRLTGARIRCHGDLQLGKLLFTGKDYVIVDFDGDGKRPLADRRRKRPSLRDVATLIHSFEHAVDKVLADPSKVREADRAPAARWGRLWSRWMSVALLRAYLQETGDAPFVGHTREERALTLDLCLIEVAMESASRALTQHEPPGPLLDVLLRFLRSNAPAH
jgi:maltose alpha-D-glucosyltransferase/alpha-amylase